jgi:hypothetical protein
MEVVEVLVGKSALSRTLSAMREWLDRRRCETCSFRQIFIADGHSLQIGFPAGADATAFANQFDGQLMQIFESAPPAGSTAARRAAPSPASR